MVAQVPAALLLLLAAAGTAHGHEDYPRNRARQDPHAIPSLENIKSGMPIEPPVPLRSQPTPGAPPPFPGAPNLPAIPNMAKFPPGGRTPPTDSPEVKGWLAEVAASGVQIPDIPVNAPGDDLCVANKEAASKGGPDGTCWWSCTQCTRDTDIVQCPNKMDWGHSFDDGPSAYTPKMLNYLEDNHLKASFYVIGANVVDHPENLQATYLAGHEICSHTWTHPALTTKTNEEIVAEFGWTREIIKAVIGVTITSIRPPYGDIDNRVAAIARAMGLTPVIWTQGFDTDDWRINSGGNSRELFEGYKKMLDTLPTLDHGVISLQHDVYQGTVDLSVGYFLPAGLSHNPAPKYQAVIECQQKSISEAYVETRGGGGGSPSGGSTGGASSGGTSSGGSSAGGTSSGGASGGSSGGDPKSGGTSSGDPKSGGGSSGGAKSGEGSSGGAKASGGSSGGPLSNGTHHVTPPPQSSPGAKSSNNTQAGTHANGTQANSTQANSTSKNVANSASSHAALTIRVHVSGLLMLAVAAIFGVVA